MHAFAKARKRIVRCLKAQKMQNSGGYPGQSPLEVHEAARGGDYELEGLTFSEPALTMEPSGAGSAQHHRQEVAGG